MKYRLNVLFRIDEAGNIWFVRILFSLLVLVNVGAQILPFGDRDFTAFYNFMNSLIYSPEMIETVKVTDIPLTNGNILFLLVNFFAQFMILIGGFIYLSVFIRNVRKARNLPGICRKSKLILRIFIISIISLIALIPFSFMLLYLSLIFIIILPCLMMYPACYLSGDSSAWSSIKDCVSHTKGYYLINARNISLLALIGFGSQFLVYFIGNRFPVPGLVLSTFAGVYLCLVLFRYIGLIYIRMIDVPGNPIMNPDILGNRRDYMTSIAPDENWEPSDDKDSSESDNN